MNSKILIIKLGALGDVIRTTPLLRVLKGEITWVTKANALPLLQRRRFLERALEISTAFRILRGAPFDLVLSLEEDSLACELAGIVRAKELIGTFKGNRGIQYTDSAREWFDMSLISRLSKKTADKKKWENKASYQEIIFRMIGRKFQGEEYLLPYNTLQEKVRKTKIVGLETRAGERWMAKRWGRFPDFIKILTKNNIPFSRFKRFPTLLAFMKEIDSTSCVITTDSLALHLALGLKKKVIALFTCTSPTEIYGYARTIKIASPLLHKYFYTTKRTLKPGEAVKPEKVFCELQKIIQSDAEK